MPYHVFLRDPCQSGPVQCIGMTLLSCHGRESSHLALLVHSWQIYAAYTHCRRSTGRGFAHAQSEVRKQISQLPYVRCVLC